MSDEEQKKQAEDSQKEASKEEVAPVEEEAKAKAKVEADQSETDKDATEAEEAVESAPAEEEIAEEKGKWYVVHTQSGFEAKAKEALEQRIKTLGFEEKIYEIIVPLRDIVMVKKGKKTHKKEKVFPGYILVRMELDNDSWIVVRTTQGITGFVGAGTKPTPISQKEVQAIMKFVKQDQPRFKAKFSVGEAVKITDGPFSDFVGTINFIDEGKGKVTVLVSIFGRETPVELDFLQINKL